MKARPALSPFIILVSLILFIIATTAHAQSGAGDSPEKIILQLKWRHQFQFAGYYAAIEKGFYRDAGLEVELREGAPEINPSEEVLAGRAQYGVSDPVLIIERNQGRPLVVLAAIFQHSPLALFSLKQSGISTPHDLVGRRVWMRPALEAGLVVMLRNEGVSLDKISVPASFQDVSDLIDGRVDAIAGYITDRPFELEKRGLPYCTIHPQTYGIDFYGDCLFSSEQKLRNNPKQVCAFLSATMKGWEYAMQHQAEMADSILRKYPSHRTREQLLFEARAMENLIMPEFIELGHMNPGRWRHIGDTYVKAGMLRPDYSMAGLLYDPKAQRYSAVIRQAAYAAGCITVLVLLGLCIILLFNKRLKGRVAHRTTELEQAAHTLRESQERFRAIAENMPDAIIISDGSGIIRYCNSAAETMLGYGKEELIGQMSRIILPQRLREKEAQEREAFVKSGKSESICTTIISIAARKDGSEFPVEFPFFSWTTDGELFFAAILRDITERRMAEEALLASEERFSKMAASIQDGLSIVEGGEIVYCNDRVCEILGCTREEMPRFSRLEMVDPQDRERLRKVVEDIRTTGAMPSELDYWILRSDGTRRCIHNSYTSKVWENGLVNRYVVTTDITEQKQAEEALQKERGRLNTIIMTSPVIICGIAGDGTVSFINTTGEDITGYSTEELKGRNWWDLFYPGDLRGQVDALFEKLGLGDVSNHEMTLQTKSGARRTILWNSMTERDDRGNLVEVIGFGNDITERKLAENDVRQARDFLENVFKVSPDAIIVTDDYGNIIMANESVESVYGYRPEELIGQHVSIFAPDDETTLQKTMAMLEELYEKGFVRNFAAERRHKDVRTIQVESSVVQMKNADGTPLGGIVSSRDVTGRRRMEEQLRQSQKMEAIGTLAGGIAHDFNNILGIILGYAELSHDLAAGNRVLAENLAQILKAAERARDLVRQILAFSRKGASDVKPLQLHLIIKECLKLLRASLPSTIDIKMDIDEADDIVVADPTEIHQIIMNLCTNAAHAMDQTGGHLEVQLKALEIDTHSALTYSGIEPGQYVLLSVRDTGPGIPADIVGRVLEPFFTTKGVGKGTGMGLSVVHGIVKRLKGDIKVYSEPGRGSVFHVVLPRVEEKPRESSAEAQAAPRGHERVLLVDDEAILINVGEKILSSLGYSVTALCSPIEALELFKKDPAAFDIVITDQTMPGLTGYELAQQLMEIRTDIPIILCTGYSDLVTAESALAGGIKAFIIKPLNRLSLAETIRRVLGASGA